jgi:phage shock protein A
MAGLIERAVTVIQAKLSKLIGRAEDPRETLDYSYEKQLEMLQNVKRGVADVVTAKKRLQLQAQKLEQGVVKLDSQAREAIGAGREDLARTALERKVGVQQQLQDLDRQTQELEAQQQKLVENERTLSTRIESFRSEKEVIKAQYSAAEAQVKIGEAATGIGDQMQNTGQAVQRAREKTEEMQARGQAMDELIASGTLEDVTSGSNTQLDRELAQIASQSEVDKELEKMKAEVGAGAGQKELEQ